MIPKEEVSSFEGLKMEDFGEDLEIEAEVFVKVENFDGTESPNILVKIEGLKMKSESEKAKFVKKLLDPKNPSIVTKRLSKKLVEVSD